jgi:GNAT superfamily N-acetyltransferase
LKLIPKCGEEMIIRRAKIKDAFGIAKVHVDSWKTTYKNIVPDDYLNKLSYESRVPLWEESIPKSLVIVAEDEDGQIVGFSTGGKERTGNYEDYKGELYAIYILKEFQGKGLGTKLVKPIMDELASLGINTMLVIVLEDNPSRYFYEALGAEKIESLEIQIGGKKLREAVYGWDDINLIYKREGD